MVAGDACVGVSCLLDSVGSILRKRGLGPKRGPPVFSGDVARPAELPRRCVSFLAAIDCAVGAWMPWTACSSPCGVGSRERERLVTIPPRNGGAPCPDVRQRRGCYGHHPDQCHSVKEVAKILPDTFKRTFKDPWKRPHMMAKEQRSSYCAYFRMKEVSASCHRGVWTNHLFREKNVCVECQGEAMGTRDRCEGDGRQGTRTFWISASHPRCHGSWVLESMQRNCNCSPKSLIFV
ncbi:somatomedin-B and thrombospondin type-1 domain-containing protein-like [Amblyraja radiata]|uniref:somatomedin-B and thrombospondin type-1 domain-containing protein-like n=1 Tax=Amblyraja radiata TaxID=386614 RepID=UPI001401BD74|nr:somatomedin-B and thrombospondin type-1 domain-containing protein-like [Amblyraja radiata]